MGAAGSYVAGEVKDSGNEKLDDASGKGDKKKKKGKIKKTDYVTETVQDVEYITGWMAEKTDMGVKQYQRNKMREEQRDKREELRQRYSQTPQSTQDSKARLNKPPSRRESRITNKK